MSDGPSSQPSVDKVVHAGVELPDTHRRVPGDHETSGSNHKQEDDEALVVLPTWKSQRYELRGVLGRGGFGTVYLGWDRQLQRQVAIKIPREEVICETSTRLAFLREARIAARLQHPGIVAVYDCGVDDGNRCFVVYEYVAGHSLQHELNGTRWPVVRAKRLIATIAEALHSAHKQGLVHRDLKPGNVLLDEQGRPRITDFGLAVDEQTQSLLQGEIAGTTAYMAPEQLRGEVNYLDGRTDVWALGVMLYELLAGRRPFRGDNRAQLVDEILHREARPLRQVRDDVSPHLDVCVMRCISKNVAERYSSAQDLADVLKSKSPQATNNSGENTVDVTSTGNVDRRRALQWLSFAAGGLTVATIGSWRGGHYPEPYLTPWEDLFTNGRSNVQSGNSFKVERFDFAVSELGTATARDYQVEVTAIAQPVLIEVRDPLSKSEGRFEYSGQQGWGLFFGLREHPQLPNGLQVLEFETITVRFLGKDEFELRRSRVVYKRAGQTSPKSGGPRDTVPSDPPEKRSRKVSTSEAEDSVLDQGSIRVPVGQIVNWRTEPMRLKIAFEDAQLASVSLNEREWPELRGESEQPGSAEPRGIPSVGKYPLVGRFGVVAEHVRIKLEEGRYRYLFDPR